ncbi:MAG TPA: PAS domain S-box protein [Polyangiales bacterium]|nr:PAS domain S-box protein [Polyangiales bacterium]
MDRKLTSAQALVDALTQAADAAGIGVNIAFLSDTGAELAYTNPGAAEQLGIPVADLAHRPVWSFAAPDELPKLQELHGRWLRGEQLQSTFSTVLLRPDGTRVPVELAVSRIELEGRPATVTFVFDATHRHDAQAALARSEADFRALAESAPDGIVILRWPIIAYLNRVAAGMLGFESVAEAIGQNLLERLIPIDAQQASERARQRMNGSRTDAVAEYTVRGSTRVFEISATPIQYAGAPAMLAFARDVTERKAIVTRLMESEKLAAVGTLAAGVAHEINNPLTYMLLNLELAVRQLALLPQGTGAVDTLLKHLEQVREGGERVKTIVRDLQTFTRRDDERRGPLRLETAVEAALGIAGHALRHSVKIVRRFEPAPAVLGNTMRFEQLFLNLILNAVHALSGVEQARQVIEVEVRPDESDSVLVVVRDHGSGMSRETLGRAFEPFFTTKPIGAGTGLGLPICWNIVRAAGGEIVLHSELGQGTTAELRFPAHRGESVAPAGATPLPPPIETPMRRASILVIDDEPSISSTLAGALSEEHDVETCDSAVRASELLCSGRHFDVVLCDMVMPNKDGAALFREVCAERPELASRFVFMTGGASLPQTEQFLKQNDNPRLMKPFQLPELRDLLRKLL